MRSMRSWMNLIETAAPTLHEAVRLDLVYHGTSAAGLVGIFHYDEMGGHDNEEPYGVSLTRDPRFAARFATGKSKDIAWHVEYVINRSADEAEKFRTTIATEYCEYEVGGQHGVGGAIIAFDRNRLTQRVRLAPISAPGENRRESEEKTVGDLKNATRYIVGVQLLDPAKFAAYEQAVLNYQPEFKAAFDAIRRFVK